VLPPEQDIAHAGLVDDGQADERAEAGRQVRDDLRVQVRAMGAGDDVVQADALLADAS
jgi:hypothetical protein